MPIITTRKSEVPEPLTGELLSKKLIQKTETITKIENKYLPEEIVKTCENAVKLYNLFETKLPTTGHIALMTASQLTSMCINMDRQFNLAFGAPVGQGKTTVLSQFCTIPFVNYMNRTTYADYMLMHCGKFLKAIGKRLPHGVKYDKRAKWRDGEPVIDVSEAEDRITDRVDIITDGESLFYQTDLEKLLQFWNAILEQGFYRGGDQYSGHYVIGTPENRVRHGLALACTTDNFNKYILTDIGWNSRCVLAVWENLDCENLYIRHGIRNNLLDDSPEFYFEVSKILSHLNPKKKVTIEYSGNEVEQHIIELENSLKEIRLEKPGLRATKDVKRILRAFAFLNLDFKVRYEHVIFVKALINSLCKRIQVGDEYRDLGSRLHFIVSLLNYLGYNEKETIQYLTQHFTWWNSNSKSLYTEEEIKRAMKEVNID